MAARVYDMRRRARAVDAAREQALAAAYGLLTKPSSRELSLDAIARAAGVTRATLYNQFGSRAELLVAIFRDLGRRMKSERIHAAMRLPEPEQALTAMLCESTRAYAREQLVIRKLFVFAALDSDLNLEVQRAERERRHSLAHLAARLLAGGHTRVEVSAAAELLGALTSFQAFEALAFDAAPKLIERRLLDLVWAGLGIGKGKGLVG